MFLAQVRVAPWPSKIYVNCIIYSGLNYIEISFVVWIFNLLCQKTHFRDTNVPVSLNTVIQICMSIKHQYSPAAKQLTYPDRYVTSENYRTYTTNTSNYWLCATCKRSKPFCWHEWIIDCSTDMTFLVNFQPSSSYKRHLNHTCKENKGEEVWHIYLSHTIYVLYRLLFHDILYITLTALNLLK